MKGKEFAPKGNKCFPFRVNPFSEGRHNNFKGIFSLESVSIPINVFIELFWSFTLFSFYFAKIMQVVENMIVE